jgi:hypothetical protein
VLPELAVSAASARVFGCSIERGRGHWSKPNGHETSRPCFCRGFCPAEPRQSGGGLVERSQRKLRPSLPRLKDLHAAPQPPKDPTAGRDAQAASLRATDRARAAEAGARRWCSSPAPTSAASKCTSSPATAAACSAHAWPELPCEGPTVSALVAEGARSTVLSTHLAARALAVGIETAKGRALLDARMKLVQRAERTAVTAYDLAQRLAEAQRKANPNAGLAWLHAISGGLSSPNAVVITSSGSTNKAIRSLDGITGPKARSHRAATGSRSASTSSARNFSPRDSACS